MPGLTKRLIHSVLPWVLVSIFRHWSHWSARWNHKSESGSPWITSSHLFPCRKNQNIVCLFPFAKAWYLCNQTVIFSSRRSMMILPVDLRISQYQWSVFSVNSIRYFKNHRFSAFFLSNVDARRDTCDPDVIPDTSNGMSSVSMRTQSHYRTTYQLLLSAFMNTFLIFSQPHRL